MCRTSTAVIWNLGVGLPNGEDDGSKDPLPLYSRDTGLVQDLCLRRWDPGCLPDLGQTLPWSPSCHQDCTEGLLLQMRAGVGGSESLTCER